MPKNWWHCVSSPFDISVVFFCFCDERFISTYVIYTIIAVVALILIAKSPEVRGRGLGRGWGSGWLERRMERVRAIYWGLWLEKRGNRKAEEGNRTSNEINIYIFEVKVCVSFSQHKMPKGENCMYKCNK
jgi:hypothetical protein